MEYRPHSEIRRIVELAKILGRGETADCTDKEWEEAMDVVVCNKQCWRILDGGSTRSMKVVVNG